MSESPEKNSNSTTDDNNNDRKPIKSSLKTSSNDSNSNSTTGTKLPPINKKVSTTTNAAANHKKRPMTAKGPRNKTVPKVDKFRKTVGKNINSTKNSKSNAKDGETIQLVRKEQDKANDNADHTVDNDKPRNDVVVPIINEIKEDEPTDRVSGDEQESDTARRPTTPNIEALVHKAAFLLEYNASLSSRHNSQVWNKASTTAKDNHQEVAPITMKGSIPILPMWLAVLCCIFNFIIPGLGTIISGLSLLCQAKKKGKERIQKLRQCLMNVSVGIMQFACIVFCLIGWFWSIIWGTIMIALARESAAIIKSRSNSVRASSSRNSTFRDSIVA